MTNSSQQPKIKFKKRNKASFKKKQLRKTTDDVVATTNNENVGDKAIKTEDAPGNDSVVKVEEDAGDNNNHVGENEEEEEEPSALHTILAVERRRKLLGGGRNRGVDLMNLGKHTLRATPKEGSDTGEASAALAAAAGGVSQNKDLEERLKVNFAGGKLAGSNDMGGDDEGGILAKKHRKAMEDYIASNLTSKEGGAAADSSATGNNASSEGEGKKGGNRRASQEEKEIYAELLTSDANEEGDADGKEGDVGAGGAMMGGTGIAEVALPIDERIRALQATERAAMEHERARKARFGHGMGHGEDGGVGDGGGSAKSAAVEDSSSLAGMVPVNFAAGPGKRKRTQNDIEAQPSSNPTAQSSSLSKPSQSAPVISPIESSALPPSSSSYHNHSASSAGPSVRNSDVSALGASYSHNFQLHTREWATRKRDERENDARQEEMERAAEEAGDTEMSKARLGFEMSRRLARGEVVAPPPNSAVGDGGGGDGKGGGGGGGGGAPGNRHQSSDERVWRTFMSKQRNRR